MIRLLISLAAIAFAPLAGRPQVPVEPPGSMLVIDAVAFDRDGMPLSDLSRDELEVWIRGYRVPIETFVAVGQGESDTRPRSIVLILDDLTLDPVLIPRAREAARRFVEQMSPEDRMAIVTLSGTVTEITSDRLRLRRSLDSYNPRASGLVRIDELGAQVLATIESQSRQLEKPTGHRKTIVGIGAAWVFDTPLPPPAAGRDLRPEWIAAMRAMAFANVNFYVLEPGGVGMSPTYGGSSGFARETGGHAFVNTNDLNGAADRIMREARTYYLIIVRDPPVGRKTDLRELDVRVLRKGVTVRARRAIPGAR